MHLESSMTLPKRSLPFFRIAMFPSLTQFDAHHAELPDLDGLVFPELVDGGYLALAQGDGVHEIDDSFLCRFRQAARDHSCLCLAGTVALKSEYGSQSNTCLVYQQGRRIFRYDKIHLFRPAGDARYFTAGRSIGSFPLAGSPQGLRAGIIICYDLRFPELTRTLADSGVAVLFVPARWPAKRDDAWRTLLKARAIENQIFTVGCNARGKEGGFSYVFDPTGKMVFSSRISPRDPYHIVDLNLAALGEAKELHNNIKDARLLHASTIPHHLPAPRRGARASHK
jgi:omega-amidase